MFTGESKGITDKHLSLYIELTSLCNLRCPYCYNNSGSSYHSIPYDLLVKQIKSVIPNYRCSVSLSGGEPMMYPRLFDLILFLFQSNIPVSIASNGVLVDSKFVDFLNINHISLSHFQISLDGPSEHINCYTRGAGHFNSAVKSIELLNKNNVCLHINCVINKYNSESINDLIIFAINNGIKRLNFSFMNNIGRAQSNSWLDIPGKIKSKIIEEIKEAKSHYQTIDISGPELNYTKCPLLNPINRFISPRIDSEGNVYVCHMFTGYENSIGNIHNFSLHDMVIGSAYSEFVEKIRKASENRNEICENCLFEKFCGGLCPALYIMRVYDNRLNLDELCDARKSKIINFIMNHKSIT